MIGYIYQIENLVTHQSYIGQTVDINRRKNTHFRTLENNKHENQKLQNSFNKYGEQEFHFRYWTFGNITPQDLNKLECEYIEQFDSINNGFNLIPGGGAPPLHQKINNDDVITFLCIQNKYGDGYGKTFEEIFGWSSGTASAIKRRKRFLKAIDIFDNLTDSEKDYRAEKNFSELDIQNKMLQRQLSQGGCKKSYLLTQDDYNFAFMAQQLGYTYSSVAKFLGIKSATVKDWFNGRSRNKEREQFNKLRENEKNQLDGRVKIAGLSGNPKLESSI